MARGCWVLRPEWAIASLEAGRWLNEEDYEVAAASSSSVGTGRGGGGGEAAAFRGAQLSRQARHMGLPSLLHGLTVYLPPDPEQQAAAEGAKSPDRLTLQRLVRAAGGTLAQSAAKASVAIRPTAAAAASVRRSCAEVTHLWLFDSLSRHSLLPYAPYAPPPAPRSARRATAASSSAKLRTPARAAKKPSKPRASAAKGAKTSSKAHPAGKTKSSKPSLPPLPALPTTPPSTPGSRGKRKASSRKKPVGSKQSKARPSRTIAPVLDVDMPHIKKRRSARNR